MLYIAMWHVLTAAVQGEVLLKCFHKKSHSGVDAVFRCQFHTAIVRDTLR